MNEQANKEIVRSFFELGNRSEFERRQELLTEDFVLCGQGMPGSGMTHTIGKPALLDSIRNYQSRFRKPVTIRILQMTAEDDRVAVKADSDAILGDGTPYANKYHFLITLEYGRIARIEEYCCTYTVAHTLRASGVAP